MKKLFLIFGLLIFTFGSAEAQHSDSNKNKQIISDLQAQAAAEYTVARLEALEMQKKNK